jgi:serine/threonine protein phosphatase PrpC
MIALQSVTAMADSAGLQSIQTFSEVSASVCLGTTPGKPLLQLHFGHASSAVFAKPNEDFYGVVTPAEDPEASTRGVSVAIADGVSANGNGRLASETTVKCLLRDFYGAPPAWNITQALDKLLRAANDWLLSSNSRSPEQEAVVTTLSMVLFKGNHYHLAHVGDSRVYRYRRTAFEQLTSDHTWQRRDMRHVLKRAVGLDSHLVVDYMDGELLPGDAFLLVSDGVWEVLGDKVMQAVLAATTDAQAAAESLVEHSIRNQVQYMGRNDATAVVVAVEALAASS